MDTLLQIPTGLFSIYEWKYIRSVQGNTPDSLDLAHTYNRTGPKFHEGAILTSSIYGVCNRYLQEYRVWVLARMVSSNGKHVIPGFDGFVLATGKKINPIDEPFTEYSVIKELLGRSEMQS